MSELRSKFKNNSPGVMGVVIYDEDNRRRGIAVKPGEEVLLAKRDEVATANAPRQEKDNPFLNGLDLVTTAENMENARPIGSTMERSEPVAEPVAETLPPEGEPPRVEREAQVDDITPPLPEGDPELGARTPGEEVGTPEAVAQAGTAKRTGRGTTVKSGSAVSKPPAEPGKPQAVVVGVGGAQYAGATPSTEE